MKALTKITIESVFDLQNQIELKHRGINLHLIDFMNECIELCINRNMYSIDANKCNKESLQTFGVLFQEAISSLINAYRVALWGATTDAFAILRNVMEGLGFISNIVEEGDFDNIFDLMEKDKLKWPYIDSRLKKDKVLEKHIGKISGLAGHFTEHRLAQRIFVLGDKPFARIASALYEKENDLTKRLGYLGDTCWYAVMILKEFNDKYHKECTTKEFYTLYSELKQKYNNLVSNTL